MKESTRTLLVIVAAMAVSFGVAACADEPRAEPEEAVARESSAAREGTGEHASAEGGDRATSEQAGEHARSENDGEHDEEGGEHGSGEEAEESGEQIGREDTWDATRNGARLVLSFDPASNAFVGTVENTTRRTLCAVRVEVHLSTGTELGPTERTDLTSGETTTVRLPTGGEAFATWTAHPEISACMGVSSPSRGFTRGYEQRASLTNLAHLLSPSYFGTSWPIRLTASKPPSPPATLSSASWVPVGWQPSTSPRT